MSELKKKKTEPRANAIQSKSRPRKGSAEKRKVAKHTPPVKLLLVVWNEADYGTSIRVFGDDEEAETHLQWVRAWDRRAKLVTYVPAVQS